jgi:signal transduction histidine kinase/heme exporter protein D
MKLAHRLLIYSFAVVSVLVLSIVTIIDRRLHSRIVQQTVAQLGREARLTALQWRPAENADSLADAAGAALGHRVTLVTADGHVTGDSEFDPSRIRLLENHSRRPEIIAARKSGIGSARRLSASAGDEELYVAVSAPLGFARVSTRTREVDDVFDSARRDVLFAGAVALLVALGLAALFARSVSRPVIQLRDAAHGHARHDFTDRPVLAAPGEVGELAQSLHQLSRQLEALENVRRDFVANVSHELRTPLTVVRGFAETLASDDPPTDKRREFAQAISVNTRRMQRIVDDLLDLSRIESGGWVPRPEPVDLAAIALEVASAVRAAADAKHVVVLIDVPPDAGALFADRTAVRQILINLLENSIRHTQDGSATLFAHWEGTGISLGVRDTGEGIPAEHLPRIFERFYRADTGRSRETGGTGLGLAIVRHLVHAHGGSVVAESSSGAGTTIRAFFPQPRRKADAELHRRDRV